MMRYSKVLKEIKIKDDKGEIPKASRFLSIGETIVLNTRTNRPISPNILGIGTKSHSGLFDHYTSEPYFLSPFLMKPG